MWAALGKLLLKALPVIGSAASGASAGRASGREREAGINQNQDQLRLRAAQLLEDALQGRGGLDLRQKQFLEDALQSRAGLDLRQRQFTLQAPQQRAKNSMRGDILANAQDAQVNGPIVHTRGQVPQMSGGLRPSLMSGNTRQLGSLMSRDALMQQMAGDKFEPLPALPAFSPLPNPQIPSITPPPQSGKLDTILNIVGGIGAGFGLADQSGLLPKRNPYRVTQPTNDWQDEGIG